MKKRKILILLAVVILIIGLQMSGIGDLLTLENLNENKHNLMEFVEDNYTLAVVGFIIIYILVAGFSIPGASILTFAGGLSFGAVFGAIYVNVGATLGAFIAFLISRYFIGDWVQRKYAKQLKKFNDEIEMHGSNYLLTLRFIPLFPFFLVNILTGVLNITKRKFLWTTSVGILPGSFIYAFTGFQLRNVDTLGDILSPGIILAFILLILFALVPVLYKKLHPKMSTAHREHNKVIQKVRTKHD